MGERWRVCKRDGEWRVYQNECWYDTLPTLLEAYAWARINATLERMAHFQGASE